MRTKLLSTAAVFGGAILWAATAQALPISFGIQINGGAIQAGCSTSSLANPFGAACTDFPSGNLVGTGQVTAPSGGTIAWNFAATGAPSIANPAFSTSTINFSTSLGAATRVTVYLTQQGVTNPTSPIPLLSGFTTNFIENVDHITE